MATTGVFGQWLTALENLGLLEVLLPFLLIFTIAFAVLQKSKILGPESRRFNVIVSFVLAMASVIPHVIGRQPDVVPIINSALPNVSLLMIASMMALLLMGVFGSDVNVGGSDLAGWAVLFAIVAVGWTFLASAGVIDDLGLVIDAETRSFSCLNFNLWNNCVVHNQRRGTNGQKKINKRSYE